MILGNCVLRFGDFKLEHLWLWTKHTRFHPCSPLLYMESLHLNTKVSSTALWRNSALEPGRWHRPYHTHCLCRLFWHQVGGSSHGLQLPVSRAVSFADLTLQPFSSAVLHIGLDLQSRPPSELSCLQRHSNGQKCLPVLHSEVNLAQQVVIMWSCVWWCTSLIPTPGKWRRIRSSRSVSVTKDPVFKNQNKKIQRGVKTFSLTCSIYRLGSRDLREADLTFPVPSLLPWRVLRGCKGCCQGSSFTSVRSDACNPNTTVSLGACLKSHGNEASISQ